MKDRKVIDSKNIRTKSPVQFGIIMYLLLDKLNAPGWVWGAVGLLCFILLINFIVDLINADEVDIFKTENKSISTLKKSSFQERLEDMKTKQSS